MDKIKEIIRKEWSEVFKNKMVLLMVSFMPLMFTVLPLGILYTMRGSSNDAISSGSLPPEMAALCQNLDANTCGQYFIISQFLVLFLMLPLIIPVTIASYSIVGEKSTHTLEPVLATPITTMELLAGKMLAAVLPAIAVTYGSFLLFAGGSYLITKNIDLVNQILTGQWLFAIFLVGPLLALAGVNMAVMVSSRVNDPRIAEQLSSLVIIPLLAVFMGQSFGYFQINQSIILWMALIILVLDIGLIFFASQLFQRETILTRWK